MRALPLIALLAACEFTPSESTEATRDGQGLALMVIDVDHAMVTISGHDADEVVVSMRLDGLSHDPLDEIDSRLERDGDTASLTVDRPDGHRGALTLDVRLPSSVAIDAQLQDGFAIIRDVAALTLVDGDGFIEVRDVPGEVVIDDGDGAVRLTHVGPVTLTDGDGEIWIEDTTGDVDLVDGDGPVWLGGVAGEVVIDDRDGWVHVERVTGGVGITDGDGDITLRDVHGRVVIADGDGDIRLTDVADHEIVEDGDGHVDVR